MPEFMSNKKPPEDLGLTVKIGATVPENLVRAAKAKADAEHRGNFSRYIQSLIERDLSGIEAAISENATVQVWLKIGELAILRLKTEEGFISRENIIRSAELEEDVGYLLNKAVRAKADAHPKDGSAASGFNPIVHPSSGTVEGVEPRREVRTLPVKKTDGQRKAK